MRFLRVNRGQDVIAQIDIIGLDVEIVLVGTDGIDAQIIIDIVRVRIIPEQGALKPHDEIVDLEALRRAIGALDNLAPRHTVGCRRFQIIIGNQTLHLDGAVELDRPGRSRDLVVVGADGRINGAV